MFGQALLAGLLWLPAGPAAELDLGGPRQAHASVGTAGGEYVVTVRLRPVRAFDPATNARLNREKGRELALLALARRLAGGGDGAIAVRGARVTAAGPDGRDYALTLRVPRAGVTVGRDGKGQTAAERIAFSSALFTRKRDYLDTLNGLAAAARADLRTVRGKDRGPALRAAVAAAEKQARANFGKLAQDVRGDLLLFSAEQEEVLRAVGREERRLADECRKAVPKGREEDGP